MSGGIVVFACLAFGIWAIGNPRATTRFGTLHWREVGILVALDLATLPPVAYFMMDRGKVASVLLIAGASVATYSVCCLGAHLSRLRSLNLPTSRPMRVFTLNWMLWVAMAFGLTRHFG